MKNAKVMVTVGCLLVLLVGVGCWFLFSGKGTSDNQTGLQGANSKMQTTKISLSEAASKPVSADAKKWVGELESLLIKPEEKRDQIDVQKRLKQLKEFLKGLNPDNLEAALVLYDELGLFKQRFSREQAFLLMEAWSTFDSEEALLFSLDTIKDEFGSQAALRVLYDWHTGDISNAAQYVSKLSEVYQGGFMEAIAKKQIKDKGVEGALDWVDQIEDEKVKGMALNQIIGNWAETDPKSAAQWVSSEVPWEKSGDAPKSVMGRWINWDPVAAMEWGETLPDGEKKEKIRSHGMMFWAMQDPVAAGEYLNRFAEQEGIDSMIVEYTRTVSDKDPAAALGWAKAVKDKSLRGLTMDEVILSWAQSDPKGLKRWANTKGDEESIRKMNQAFDDMEKAYNKYSNSN